MGKQCANIKFSFRANICSVLKLNTVIVVCTKINQPGNELVNINKLFRAASQKQQQIARTVSTDGAVFGAQRRAT